MSRHRAQLGIGVALAVAGAFASGCDTTTSLDIELPYDGRHFAGNAPYAITVKIEAHFTAGMFLGTAGTVYVNGVAAGGWGIMNTSYSPDWVDVDVPIQTGENLIEVQSDNGEGYDSVTVYLDPP